MLRGLRGKAGVVIFFPFLSLLCETLLASCLLCNGQTRLTRSILLVNVAFGY